MFHFSILPVTENGWNVSVGIGKQETRIKLITFWINHWWYRYYIYLQSAASLADASLQRSAAEKYRDEQELVTARRREHARINARPPPGRHSRFGGTYILQNVKSISDKDIICHQSIQRAFTMDFDRDKNQQKRSYRIVKEEASAERRSAFSIRCCCRTGARAGSWWCCVCCCWCSDALAHPGPRMHRINLIKFPFFNFTCCWRWLGFRRVYMCVLWACACTAGTVHAKIVPGMHVLLFDMPSRLWILNHNEVIFYGVKTNSLRWMENRPFYHAN